VVTFLLQCRWRSDPVATILPHVMLARGLVAKLDHALTYSFTNTNFQFRSHCN